MRFCCRRLLVNCSLSILSRASLVRAPQLFSPSIPLFCCDDHDVADGDGGDNEGDGVSHDLVLVGDEERLRAVLDGGLALHLEAV